MKNEPSQEQLAVKDALINTLYNIFINATAGSGKTTTLVWLLSFLTNKSVLCCAFNKDIKEELEERCKIYPNVKVSTLHGLGYGILKKEYGCGAPNNSKYRKIFLDMSPKWDLPDDKEFGGRVLQLIDLLRLTYVKTLQEAIDTAKFYNISNVDNEVNIALEVIETGRAIVTDIDFTDMIYLPVYYNLAPRTRYPVICIDEIQDLNKLQRTFIFKYLAPGGRMIMVGDRFQCIYSFAGADVKSFNLLQNMPNTKVFPLSVTYRCPKAVVRYLGKYNNEIRAWDKSPEGVINQDAAIEDVRSGDAILCRNGMPLAKLCMQFLSQGVKAYIRGRDIGENLIRLLEKTKKASTIDAIKWLSEDLEKMKAKLIRAHRLPAEDIEEMPEYMSMSDKIDTIKAITYGCMSVGDAVMKIKRIFADDKREGIMLSTIHKSKGLEFDNVFIVCDWMMPSKYAKTPTEKEQENNIQFVAYSRVKKTLNFIPKETFDPYKKEKSHGDKEREFEGR